MWRTGRLPDVARAGVIVGGFFSDVSSFFSSLSDVHLLPLLIGMALFVAYLSLRALAFRNILQDAYPTERVPYLKIWGAYLAAYGFNNVIPARGGDVLKVYLVKTSVPGSSYPTIGAALLVEAIFDLCAGFVAVVFAIAMGVFPEPPSWVSLDAVDLSFVVVDGRRALFMLTAAIVFLLVVFSLVALRVRTFWMRVRQGFAVLRDHRRYLKRVWGIQGIGWLVRGAAFFFLLKAFGMPATVENVLFVLCANAVAAIFPFTPGGAGVVQALLLELFRGVAAGATIAAYGVGQQATIAVVSLAVGFLALVFVFDIRSFREVIERGRADREADREAERAAKIMDVDADVHGVAGTAEAGPSSVVDDWLESPAEAGSGGGTATGGAGTATAIGSKGPGRSTGASDDPTEVKDYGADRTQVRGDDWLAEELEEGRAREARRNARSRWRRRG